MKKIINTALSLLLLSNILIAQNNPSNKHPFHSKQYSDQLREVNAIVYKPAKEVDYYWDSTNVNWNFNDSIHYTYNPLASPIISTTYFNAGMYRDTYIYNNFNFLTKRVALYWNGINWDTSSVETYTYNSHNQALCDVNFSYASGSIANGYSTNSVYNGNGQLITDISQNFYNGVWYNSYMCSYFYNGNGELNKFVNYQWEMSDSIWQKTDSIVNIVFQYWGGTLDDSRPLTYTIIDTAGAGTLDSVFYDSNNNPIKDIKYTNQGNNWIYASLQTFDYNYDSNNNIIQSIEMTYLFTSTIASNGYKNVYSDYDSYTISAAGVSTNKPENEIVVYPNPNNGTFKLSGSLTKLSKMEIYNLLGDKVLTIDKSDLPDSKEINLANAPKGLYFVKLYETERVQTKKIIVQ